MAAVGGAIQRAAAKGMDEGDAVERALEAFREAVGLATEQSGEALAGTLQETAPRMLAEHRRIRQQFEYRLDWVWGDALDLLYQILVCCQELGESFNATHRPAAVEDQDHRFEALVQIHARACLVASEIHALLRTGHAYGAQTRWRTLHELSVVSSILGKGNDALAKRFLMHAAAEAYKDALLHEEHRERTGREPFPPEELAALKEIRDAAMQEYGPKFANPWMWAEEVTAPDRPEFWRLEKLAELDHLRPDFRTSSHLVHGGSRGADLGRIEHGGNEAFLAGPSNDGLSLPGHGAAISIVQVTLALIVHGREFAYGPEVLASLRALLVLRDETGEAFTRAEEMLDGLKMDFDRVEAAGVSAKIVNNLRRSVRRARWRVLRRSRELRPRWLARRAAHRRRSRSGDDLRDSSSAGLHLDALG